MRRFALSLFLLLLTGSAARAQPVNAPLLPLDDLKAGMKGEVWTVFRGTRPEPFSVEVTGVVRNALGPGKSLILCRLTDERVQNMGAVAGMSGSPLYIDGKLAGALSYQVQKFETVRYAGFTPIADLLEVGRQSEAAAARATRNAAPRLAQISVDGNDTLTPLSPVFAFGGVAPQVVDWLAPQFSALGVRVTALGGQMAPPAADATPDTTPLKAGDAVAVAVATGDITLAATGTVSYVDGDHVLAFGHPMMGLGNVSLPMARAEIVAILPSNENSLKVANTGAIIGTIDQDRLSAVAGELGPKPAMIPIDIFVDTPGRPARALHFFSARHAQLTPLAVGAGAAQAVLGSNDAGFSNGARLQAEFIFEHGRTVPTTAVFSGPDGVKQGLGDFTQDVGALLQNPYAAVFPARIEVHVTPLEHNPLTTLEYVRLSRAVVQPGGQLDVTVGWRDYQGMPGHEVLHVPVPPQWQGRKLAVLVANGNTLDQMTGRPTAITASQLRSFDAYLDFIRHARHADGLTVAVVEDSQLFVDQTHTTRDLPGSLARIAQRADQNRYQVRPAVSALWEQRMLAGRLVPGVMRQPFSVSN
jgi:hypothetical protein